MARKPHQPPPLPPPTVGQVWVEFLKWSVGLPVVVLAALAVIAGASWLAGPDGMMGRAAMDMGTSLWWLAVIVVLYPVALVFLVWDLRDGLRAARAWAAMTEDERQAARAAQATGPGRRKGRRDDA